MPSSLKRPISAALKTDELSPEAKALIQEGTPKPQIKVEAPSASELRTDPAPVSSIQENEDQTQAEFVKPTRQRTSNHKETAAAPVAGLVSAPFRLPAEISQALMSASFDRKINRQKPSTQQEIAAESLSGQLKKNGYL
jgi:hypothetical protein